MSEHAVSCQAVQTQLDAWLTHEVAEGWEDPIREHVAICPQCSAFLEDLQTIRTQIARAQATPLPEIDMKMENVIGQIAADQQAASSRRPSPAVRWKDWLFWAAYIFSGLLLLCILDAPWASRLFTVGVVLNLCGLILLPYLRRNQLDWGQR